MTGLVIVLLVVVGFFWMFNRSIKAGYGKFLFWLLWMIAGICSLLALPQSARPVAQVLVWLWMAGVLGLPVYWFLRSARKHRPAAPPPPPVSAELQPILDEKGKQVFP